MHGILREAMATGLGCRRVATFLRMSSAIIHHQTPAATIFDERRQYIIGNHRPYNMRIETNMQEKLLLGQRALAHAAGEEAIPSGEGRWPRICERAVASPTLSRRRQWRVVEGRLTDVL